MISGPKSSPSVPEADTTNTSSVNRMDSTSSTGESLSNSWPQARFVECNQREVNSPSRQLSISSSGYESSLNGSFSSLVSPDAVNVEHSTNANIKKCATYPRFDTIEGGLVMWDPSPGMPRSISASSMEQFTSCDCGSVPSLNTSPRASNSENNNDDENQKGNTAYQRFYRAMYTYESAGNGEVAFRKGDEVEVIQRSENGWWLVRTRSGKVGWGPSNFLQSLSS